MARRIAIVPHTHWDREWYEPFQTFRMRLVDLIDDLVDLMESDPSYAKFMLDGQMAVIDDYLEIRPEAEARIRELAGAGRLGMGPWYILMDEFLVSGETIWRDLQLGLDRAACFGGAMEVGYLPDMFGHIAQMPQILRLAGFEHAVVWRGVPSAVNATGFWWSSPDGSTVRAEYLPVGYGNGSAIPNDPDSLVRRISDHVQELGPLLTDGLLYMNGTDHQAPQPWLGSVVAKANAAQSELMLDITSIADYLKDAPTDGLVTWEGELRSGFRSNLLMGVASNRVDVKQAAARTERVLERRAEPMAALLLPADLWPARLLDLAWLEMIRNSAHDSICACSVDDVVDAVLGRYVEARRIGEGVEHNALVGFARSLDHIGPVVLNMSARPRSGMVEVLLAGTTPPPGTQPVTPSSNNMTLPQGSTSVTLDANATRSLLNTVPGDGRIDDHTWVSSVSMTDDEDGIHLQIGFDRQEVPDLPVAAIKQDLYTLLGARPDAMVHLTLEQPENQMVLARTAEIPGFGWAPFEPARLLFPVHRTPGRSIDARGDSANLVCGPGGSGPGGSGPGGSGPGGSGPGGSDPGEGADTPRDPDDAGELSPDMDPHPVVLGNGLLEIEISPDDGTWSINGIRGFGRLVDMGDHGDSYNYSPPADDQAVDQPDSVRISLEEAGPVRGRAVIVSSYVWPERIDEASRSRVGSVQVEVQTTLELRADDPVLRVETTYTNTASDHRLRVHFPLPEPATVSRAECAFAVVERGLYAEGREDEFGLPTRPSRRFVSAGGLTVIHEGLCEYELVDSGRSDHVRKIGLEGSVEAGDRGGSTQSQERERAADEIAVTLLRSTGMLSRLGMAYRPLPAGPLTPVAGLQLLGHRMTARYALYLGHRDPYSAADDVFIPVDVVYGSGTGDRAAAGQALAISGAEVSAVRRRRGGLEIRLFNPTPTDVTVDLFGRSGWVVDLRDRPMRPFKGSLDMTAWSIATLHLTG